MGFIPSGIAPRCDRSALVARCQLAVLVANRCVVQHPLFDQALDGPRSASRNGYRRVEADFSGPDGGIVALLPLSVPNTSFVTVNRQRFHVSD